jgi:hypothetical protein
MSKPTRADLMEAICHGGTFAGDETPLSLDDIEDVRHMVSRILDEYARKVSEASGSQPR